MFKKILKKSLIIVLVAYVFAVLYMFIVQRDYVYFPLVQDFDVCEGFKGAEKINTNGTRAYYKNNSDKLIVFYHGNAGSACDRNYLKNEFEEAGFSYLFVEYAGYSNDINKPSKDLLMQDVRNINKFLETIEYSELVIAGESIGDSFALYHSSLVSEGKVMLISPFYSLSRIGQIHYPIFPVKFLLRDDYDNSEWIYDLNNIAIIHGTKDSVIPIRESKKLFNEIEIDNKKFIEVEGGGHNTIYNFSETFLTIADFLNE